MDFCAKTLPCSVAQTGAPQWDEFRRDSGEGVHWVGILVTPVPLSLLRTAHGGAGSFSVRTSFGTPTLLLIAVP